MRHHLFLVISAICFATFVGGQTPQPAVGYAAGNQILWDSFGVPHIYAENTTQMYYEFGWAQMHNHANLILQLYGQARGRASEYWGEKYLASDKQVQLFRVPSIAAKEYGEQDPGFRGFLDAFIEGMNAYARAHPDAIREENRPVLPVRAEDVIAHGIRVVFLRFVAGEKLGMARGPENPAPMPLR